MIHVELNMTDSILTIADKLVSGDRNNDYGHPLDDFTKTAKLWSVILGVEVTPVQIGLCMICVKLSRQCNKHKDDNLIDIAGYAKTIKLVVDEQSFREEAVQTFSKL